MRKLIVVAYESEFKADETRLAFLKMQQDYLVNIEDAVVVVRNAEGKVKLHQLYRLTASGALSGGFWGTLIGLIFLNPLLGLAIGAGSGAIAGALTDVGINDKFMKELGQSLKPSSSALFILADTDLSDKVLEVLKGTGGTILQSSLSHVDEDRLQAALSDKGETEQVVDVKPTKERVAVKLEKVEDAKDVIPLEEI